MALESVLRFLLPDGTSTSVSVLLSLLYLLVAYVLGSAIYDIAVHPLSRIPGPKLCAVSRIPYWGHLLGGTDCEWLRRLHQQYGPVVRFGPNDVCYNNAAAWKDIYGVERGVEFPRAPESVFVNVNGVHSMFTAPYEDHNRMRRLFSPAFSERGLRAQEPLFRKYTDLLIAKMHELGDDGEPVEMTRLYNFVSFDTMGELCFGHSLGLLAKNEFSPWVWAIFQSLKMVPMFSLIMYYPILKTLFTKFQPKSILEQRLIQWQYAVDQVDQRLQENPSRPDIWNLAMEAQESEKELSLGEMHSNAEIFILAGSETTATVLSGVTYFLLKNPDKLKLLVEEIRGTFRSPAELSFDGLANLPYLNACLRETMRIYPAVPIGSLRVVPQGGHAVAGRWLPGGTRVMVSQWASYRNETNFRDEGVFAPERWLGGGEIGEEEGEEQQQQQQQEAGDRGGGNKKKGGGGDPYYAGDARGVHQPFSFGPRNCLGKSMAWHEMRLVFASLLFHFDLEFGDEETRRSWPDQRTYVVWEKKPLMCRVRPVTA